MTTVPDELSAARQRIAAAYDPGLVEDAGRRLAELLAGNLARAERSDGAVLPWAEPAAAVREARAFLHAREEGGAASDGSAPQTAADGAAPLKAAARDSAAVADQFADLVRTMLERGLNLHDPRYIGHQVPAPVPLAGLFDAVGSVTNQVMAIYEMGPWATRRRAGHGRRVGRGHRLGSRTPSPGRSPTAGPWPT